MKGQIIRWDKAVLLHSTKKRSIYIWHLLVLVCDTPPGLKGKPNFVRTVFSGISLTSSSTLQIWGIFSQIRTISKVRGFWNSGGVVPWHFRGLCTAVGWTRPNVTSGLIVVPKPGIENMLKVFILGKKIKNILAPVDWMGCTRHPE